MAMNVLRKIAGDPQATEFFAIMINECTDVANQEQVNINYTIYRKVSLWCSYITGGFSFAVG